MAGGAAGGMPQMQGSSAPSSVGGVGSSMPSGMGGMPSGMGGMPNLGGGAFTPPMGGMPSGMGQGASYNAPAQPRVPNYGSAANPQVQPNGAVYAGPMSGTPAWGGTPPQGMPPQGMNGLIQTPQQKLGVPIPQATTQMLEMEKALAGGQIPPEHKAAFMQDFQNKMGALQSAIPQQDRAAFAQDYQSKLAVLKSGMQGAPMGQQPAPTAQSIGQNVAPGIAGLKSGLTGIPTTAKVSAARAKANQLRALSGR